MLVAPRTKEHNGRQYVSVTSGIYRIVNMITNRTYIGSSVDVGRRLKAHRDDLVKRRHGNKHLLASWVKHGPSAFAFEPLVECERTKLAQREQRFIDAYLYHDLPLFNQKPSAESQRGFRHDFTAEHRANIGKASTGRFFSAESRERMSTMRKGRVANNKGVPHKPESIAKISAALRGKKFTAEHRAKIALANRNRSPELLARIIASRRGYRHSPETREKLSTQAKRRDPSTRKHSLETIMKISAARWKHSDESKAKMKAHWAKLRQERPG